MKRFLFTAAIALTMTVPAMAQEAVYDPIEPVNRGILSFNNAVDTVILDPAVVGYRAVTPKPVRTGIRNFVRHLESPLYFANNLLQGDLNGAGVTLQRAIINTFVGFGGVWDVAGENGIKEQPEDFGQTLAVWGVGEGPYLVLPILGPSNLRDTGGMIVDGYADPLNRYAMNTDKEEIIWTRAVVKGFVAKDAVYDAQKDMKANSADYYAALRSASRQYRNAAINDNGSSASDTSGNAPLPDYNIE
jgi:phospholipid-binding lipoprotein MlaA